MDIKSARLSPEAQAVWERLDVETKRNIQKTNPFKINRDQAILELKAKGLRAEILSELTGLGRSSLYRIVKRGDELPAYAKKDVKELIRAFKSFLNSLSVILADKYRKGCE